MPVGESNRRCERAQANARCRERPVAGPAPAGTVVPMTINPFGDEPYFESDEFAGLDEPATPLELAPIPPQLLAGLNPAQAEAVSTLDGPLLVVAGPGSGKTRVLTHRIAAIAATGSARPTQILAVTFTNKAAAEMRERLGKLVGNEVLNGMWVATFHSACLRILRSNPASSGLPVGFTVVDSDDAKKVMRDSLISLQRDPDASKVKEALGAISRAKNSGGLDHLDDDTELRLAATTYQARLRQMNAVDFDDILLATMNMLERNIAVRDRYRRKFRYVLVDEYQDTNLVQYRVLQALASGNICCVGDTDQAIYSWRGSTPALLARFAKDFPSAKVVLLGENYRSTPEILAVCQSVIEHNKIEHRPDLRTANASGEAVRLIEFEDDRGESSFVVSELAASRSGSKAVLMRTNAQTRIFEEDLTKRAIPYQVVGALKFYDRAEVKDALAYLRLVTNPRDIVSFMRAANTPRRGLGQVTLDGIVASALATGSPVLDVARAAIDNGSLSARATKGVAELIDHLDQVTAAAITGPAEALAFVYSEIGLRALVAADKDGPDRIQNLAELFTAARAFVDSPSSVRIDGTPVASLVGLDRTIAFLENVALVAAPVEENALATVALMTVHAAKGREFDEVYVVGLEESLFPHFLPYETPNVEEERRLLFVACSRARTRLTLSCSASRMLFGRVVQNPPSRFLRGLPSAVIKSSHESESRFQNGSSRRPPYGGTKPRVVHDDDIDRPTATWSPGKRSPAVAKGPRLAASDAVVGITVEHAAYGRGEIVNTSGSHVIVQFNEATRELDIAFAPMKRVH